MHPHRSYIHDCQNLPIGSPPEKMLLITFCVLCTHTGHIYMTANSCLLDPLLIRCCLSRFVSCAPTQVIYMTANNCLSDSLLMRCCFSSFMIRVGQNRIYTPYMTVYLVISLPKIPYVNRIYMVLADPINDQMLLIKTCLAHPHRPFTRLTTSACRNMCCSIQAIHQTDNKCL